MIYNFIGIKDNRGLVNSMFSLSFIENNLPFNSSIIPPGFPVVTYVFGDKQQIIHKKKTTLFNQLIISGQFKSAYDYTVFKKGLNIGINLHPTALYKILGINITTFTNEHVQFSTINKNLSDNFSQAFIKNKNEIKNLSEEIIKIINNLELFIDNDVKQIDIAVDFILENEGMIKVTDLLKKISLSQKSLEVKFKKIVGLTPGKYIRLTRFIRLMQKYESKQIDIHDLIYMYNYYDHSHFIKDFKLFMNQLPKIYFKKDYPLIKAYIKDI